MFTAGPVGTGLAVAAGDGGGWAGEDATALPLDAGAARLGEGRGHRRKAPSPFWLRPMRRRK